MYADDPDSTMGPSAEASAAAPGSTTRLASLRPASKDPQEVLRFLSRVLVLPVPDGRASKTPVVTLTSSESVSVYGALLERQLRAEYCVGAEKFWKVGTARVLAGA